MPGREQPEDAVRTTLPRLHVDRDTVRAHAGTAALVLVLLVAAWFRLSGADWDEGAHVHPDERYIASVSNVVDFPWSPLSYLDVEESPLSPYNTPEGRAFPYGTLPIFATKAVAELVGRGDYDHLYLVGRWLGALLDVATTVLVFLIARAVVRKSLGPHRAFQTGLLAAALYGLTVAAIQAAHFYTTDVWLVFFSTLAVYLGLLALRSLSWTRGRELGLVAAMGGCLGFAVACKASGLFVVGIVLGALAGKAAVDAVASPRRDAATRLLRDSLLALVTAYLSYRLVSPYSFAHSNWLDLRLSDAFTDALATQRDILDGKAIFPPTLQWLLSPRIVDPFENLVVWQLGIALGLCAVAGTAVLAVDAVRQAVSLRRPLSADAIEALAIRVVLVTYVVVVFVYTATRFQHMGRYLLPILRSSRLWRRTASSEGSRTDRPSSPQWESSSSPCPAPTRSRSTRSTPSGRPVLPPARGSPRTRPRVRGSRASTGTSRCPSEGRLPAIGSSRFRSSSPMTRPSSASCTRSSREPTTTRSALPARGGRSAASPTGTR